MTGIDISKASRETLERYALAVMSGKDAQSIGNQLRAECSRTRAEVSHDLSNLVCRAMRSTRADTEPTVLRLYFDKAAEVQQAQDLVAEWWSAEEPTTDPDADRPCGCEEAERLRALIKTALVACPEGDSGACQAESALIALREALK